MLPYFIKNRLKKHDAVNNLKIKSLVFSSHLQQQALLNKEPGISNDKAHSIVVSLTSFDKRIHEVYLTIESLFQQSLKADRIVLWLSTKNFPDKKIPEILISQQRRGLEIYFQDEDLGPYKKYVYAFSKFPDSLIVTVDDDILYPPDLIDQLYQSYLSNPNAIHCQRAHRMGISRSGKLLSYEKWHMSVQDHLPSNLLFATGVGGVLYFPGSLHEDAFDKEKFMSLCPNADDIWLKAMSLKSGIKVQKVNDCRCWKTRFLPIEGTQQFSLQNENKSQINGNSQKIEKVFSHFNLMPLLLRDDNQV